MVQYLEGWRGLLGRLVDVFGLCYAAELIFIISQAAKQDCATKHNDGGAPAETIRPGVAVVAFIDLFVEFHRVNYQSNDLEYH